MTAYACRYQGQPTEVTVGKADLQFDNHTLPYLDIDEVHVDGHSVCLAMGDGPDVVLTHLGRRLDEFLQALHRARAPVRRAALVQWGGEPPIDSYQGRLGQTPVDVVLFHDGLALEPETGTPAFVPLSLIDDVRRDGYTITLALRSLPPVELRQLARRTDEFLADLSRARADLAERTAEAYAAFDPALAGFTARDGWAVDRASAGRSWGALRAAVAGQARGHQVDVLESMAGERLRLGLKVQLGGAVLPFALAPVGDKVAVEATDADDRATFVFRTTDVDALNVALLITNFRREAIFLAEDQLGRWALAVRTLDAVRQARSWLHARIVHDQRWEEHVRAALS